MTEMMKLVNLLEDNAVPYEITEDFNYNCIQVWYPSRSKVISDAICNDVSFGHEEGLLEIMGLIKDEYEYEVEGWLTADEVFSRWRAHYESTKKED